MSIRSLHPTPPDRTAADYLCESREDVWIWDRIGDAYWREARPDEARRAWQRARRLRPGNPRIRHKLNALAAGLDPLTARN